MAAVGREIKGQRRVSCPRKDLIRMIVRLVTAVRKGATSSNPESVCQESSVQRTKSPPSCTRKGGVIRRVLSRPHQHSAISLPTEPTASDSERPSPVGNLRVNRTAGLLEDRTANRLAVRVVLLSVDWRVNRNFTDRLNNRHFTDRLHRHFANGRRVANRGTWDRVNRLAARSTVIRATEVIVSRTAETGASTTEVATTTNHRPTGSGGRSSHEERGTSSNESEESELLHDQDSYSTEVCVSGMLHWPGSGFRTTPVVRLHDEAKKQRSFPVKPISVKSGRIPLICNNLRQLKFYASSADTYFFRIRVDE